MSNYIETRPWGSYEILSEFKVDEPGFSDSCVKKIIVFPGKRLSYQVHKFRNEHWFVVQGQGLVILNDVKKKLKAGESLDIKIGDKHRVANIGKTDLVFIEIQTGHYDEDDNERLEDDYAQRQDTGYRGKFVK